MKPRRGARARGTTWSALCKLALKLPGVAQGVCYGTPALRVKKKFLARLKEDGDSVAIMVDFADRDVLLELDPAAFYLTDHYRPWPAMLLRLKQVRVDMLEQLVERAWRRQAPKGLRRERTGDTAEQAPAARRRAPAKRRRPRSETRPR